MGLGSGFGNGNGNEPLGTGKSGIEKDFPAGSPLMTSSAYVGL